MGKYLKLFYDNESQQTYEISKNYYEPYVGGIYANPTLTYNKFNYAKYFINYTNTETRLRDFRFNENFVEIEYLETDGTQGVLNTDFIPSGNDIKIEGKFNIKQFDSTNTAWAAIFTAYTDEYSNCYRIIRRGTTSNDLCLNCGQRAASGGTNITINFNTDYEFVLTNTQYTFGEMSGTLTSRYGDENIKNFKIGSLHHVKHYYYKIYKNDILIHDYIPVRIGKVGYLYDKITRKLFTFTNNNAILGNDKFVQIEYLETDGNAYIDTGLTISYHRAIAGKYYSPNGESMIWGSRWVSGYFQYYIRKGTKGDTYFRLAAATHTFTGSSALETHEFLFNIKESYAILDGNRCEFSDQSSLPINPNHRRELLFKYLNGSVTDGYDTKRIYWAKYWEKNKLVRDFIPVRVGNVGYMYDRVTEQLFGNVGTGAFILGPDKNLPYDSVVEYLYANSKNYDDTFQINSTIDFSRGYGFGVTYDGFVCQKNKSGFVPLIGTKFSTARAIIYINPNAIQGNVDWSNSAVSNVYTNAVNFKSGIHTIELKSINSTQTGAYLDNTLLKTLNNFTPNQSNIHLLYNETSYIYKTKIISFWVYNENNEKIFDAIPVRVGQIGYMYDKISGKLFGNEGTGEFILGPDVQ